MSYKENTKATLDRWVRYASTEFVTHIENSFDENVYVNAFGHEYPMEMEQLYAFDRPLFHQLVGGIIDGYFEYMLDGADPDNEEPELMGVMDFEDFMEEILDQSSPEALIESIEALADVINVQPAEEFLTEPETLELMLAADPGTVDKALKHLFNDLAEWVLDRGEYRARDEIARMVAGDEEE